ncbi:MAG: transposase [Verrucomicrobiota bacterium]
MPPGRSRSRLLRKGRLSIPGARYFVTLCVEQRKAVLDRGKVMERLVEALRSLQREKDINLLCAVVMPDHLHVLFTLGKRLSLSQVWARFKVQTKEALLDWGAKWQENFHDHRIRDSESVDRFAYYSFLNPYVKGLLAVDEIWAGWLRNREFRPAFLESVREGELPHSEWILKKDSIGHLIEIDMKG